eukprot:362979-Chlamydomonas_euryale.AAC.5
MVHNLTGKHPTMRTPAQASPAARAAVTALCRHQAQSKHDRGVQAGCLTVHFNKYVTRVQVQQDRCPEVHTCNMWPAEPEHRQDIAGL